MSCSHKNTETSDKVYLGTLDNSSHLILCDKSERVNAAQSTILRLALSSFSDSINNIFIYFKIGMYSNTTALLQFKKKAFKMKVLFIDLCGHIWVDCCLLWLYPEMNWQDFE